MHELLVIVIMRQRRGGFRRGNIEEGENDPANHEKEDIVNNVFLFGVHYLMGSSLTKKVT